MISRPLGISVEFVTGRISLESVAIPDLATTPRNFVGPTALKWFRFGLLPIGLGPVAFLALPARDEFGDAGHVDDFEHVAVAVGTLAVGFLDRFGVHDVAVLDQFGEAPWRDHPALNDAVLAHGSTKGERACKVLEPRRGAATPRGVRARARGSRPARLRRRRRRRCPRRGR